MSEPPNKDSLSYRQLRLEKTVENHEKRIGRNEKFRIEVWAVLRFLAFASGGGFITAIALYII